MKHGSLYHPAQSVKDRHLPERYLGRQIGKYRVTRLLGGGAFAWVYEAVDRDLEIPVALKILRPEFAGQPDAETRFRREAATAARLRHPNIVTVRDVGQIDGASFVAMDLLPLSLARRLELLGRLPEADTVRLGLDVAAALAVAHAGGIVHRDIKPDNILIGTRGEAVVADFGLARALDVNAAKSSGQQVMGTPHYFSPEQARGLELDGRSDLYSLGVTLYRTSTGRLPFEGDDWYGVARQHVEGTPPSPREIVPELSEAFEAFVMRLLNKAPEARFESALLTADALAALPSAPSTTQTLTNAKTPATETVTAFAAVAPVVTRRVRARWAAPIGALVLALGAFGAWQLPAVHDAWRRAFPPTLVVATDTSTSLPKDTLHAAATDSSSPDSARATLPSTDLPKSAGADTVRKQAAAAVKTQLILTAPDSAQLYVDGVLVGKGSATIERRGAVKLTTRAIIGDAPVACDAARRDSVVKLAVGEKRLVSLAVRTCLGVTFTVNQPDARVRFESQDGGGAVEVRADSTNSVLLPEGRYEVRASARGCAEYRGDIMTVRRGATKSELSRTIKLPC